MEAQRKEILTAIARAFAFAACGKQAQARECASGAIALLKTYFVL